VAQVDQQRAQEFFKDVQAVCEREGKRLWGMSMCGPMVIADLRTHTIATSQPAPEGPRPRGLGILNAPIEWGGVTWAAYMWDTLANAPPRVRKAILLHELFHGIVQRKGVLLESDGRVRRVAAPMRRDDTTLAGDGWTFKVAAGWVVREGARRGDDEVVRQQP
jgi:hypothetical protein